MWDKGVGEEMGTIWARRTGHVLASLRATWASTAGAYKVHLLTHAHTHAF